MAFVRGAISAVTRERTRSDRSPASLAEASVGSNASAVLVMAASRSDLEIDRPGEGVGDGRPFLHMGDQGIDFGGVDAVAFHRHLDAHVGEADRLFADVAGAPDGRDVEIALELQLELTDGPAAMHRIGMQADREAGTEGGERRLRRVGGGVVAQEGRRLVDDVGRQVADVVRMPELSFRDGLALQGLDDLRVRLAVLDKLLEPAFVDRRKTSGENDVFGSDGHCYPPEGYQPVCFLHGTCQPRRMARVAEESGLVAREESCAMSSAAQTDGRWSTNCPRRMPAVPHCLRPGNRINHV